MSANVASNGQFNVMYLRHASNYPIRQKDPIIPTSKCLHLSGLEFPRLSAADISFYNNDNMSAILSKLYPKGYPELKESYDMTMVDNSPFKRFVKGRDLSNNGYHMRPEIVNLLNGNINNALNVLIKKYRIIPSIAKRFIYHYKKYGVFKHELLVYVNPYNPNAIITDCHEIYSGRYGKLVHAVGQQLSAIPNIETFVLENMVIPPHMYKHSNYSRVAEEKGGRQMFLEGRLELQENWGPMMLPRYPLATNPIIDWETGELIMVNVNTLSFRFYNGASNNPSDRRYIYNPWRRYGKFVLDGIKCDIATNGQIVRGMEDDGVVDSSTKPGNQNNRITRYIKRLNLEFDALDIRVMGKWGIRPDQITNDIELDGQYIDENKRAMEINSKIYAMSSYDSTPPNYQEINNVQPIEQTEIEEITQNDSSNLDLNDELDDSEFSNEITPDSPLWISTVGLVDIEGESKEENEIEDEIEKNTTDAGIVNEDVTTPEVNTVRVCENDNFTYDTESNTLCKVVKVNSEDLILNEVYTKCYDAKKKVFNGTLYNKIVAELKYEKEYEFSQTFKVPSDCRSPHPVYKGIPNEFVLSTMFSEVEDKNLNNFFTTMLNTFNNVNVTAEPNSAKYYCSIRFTNKFSTYTSKKIFCKDDNNIVHNVVDINLTNGGGDSWVERKFNNYVLKYNPRKTVHLFAKHIGDEVNGGEYSLNNKNNYTETKDGFLMMNLKSGKYDGIYVITINNFYTDNLANTKDLTGVVLSDNDANRTAIAYNGESLHSNSLGLLYNTSNTEPLGNPNKYLVNKNGTKRIIKIDFIPYSALNQLDNVYGLDNHYYYSDKLSMLFTTNGFEPSAHNLDYLSKHDTEGYLKHRIEFSNLMFYNDIKIKTDINPLLEDDLERYFNNLGETTGVVKNTTLDKILPVNDLNLQIKVEAYISKESKYAKEYLYYGIRDGCLTIPIRRNSNITSNLYVNDDKPDLIRVKYSGGNERPSFIDIPLKEALDKLLVFTKPEAAIERISMDDYYNKYHPDLVKEAYILNIKRENDEKLQEQKNQHAKHIAQLEMDCKERLQAKDIECKERMQSDELDYKERVDIRANELAKEKIDSNNREWEAKLELEKKKQDDNNRQWEEKLKMEREERKEEKHQFNVKFKQEKKKHNDEMKIKDRELKNLKRKQKDERDAADKDREAKIYMQAQELLDKNKRLDKELKAKSKEADKERSFKIHFQSRCDKAETELAKLKSALSTAESLAKLKQEYLNDSKLKAAQHKHEASESTKEYKAKAAEKASELHFRGVQADKDRYADARKHQRELWHRSAEADKDRKAREKERKADRDAADRARREDYYHKERENAKDRAHKSYENNLDREYKQYEMLYKTETAAEEAEASRRDSLIGSIIKSTTVPLMGYFAKKWVK